MILCQKEKGNFMLANNKLPASLSGIDTSSFFSYWNAIKNKINDLQNLGYQISLYQQKLGVAKANLIARGKKELAETLNDEIKKTQDDLDKWWKVKGYIDKYLPEWLKISSSGGPVVSQLNTSSVTQEVKQPVNYQVYQPKSTLEDLKNWVGSWFGLEALPIIIGVASLAALTYVVTTGMALLSDYQYRKDVTALVIEKKVTGEQAKDLLEITKGSEGFLSNLGLGTGIALPVILIIGGFIFYNIKSKNE